MNAPEKNRLLPDVQNRGDVRGLKIDAVGIQGLRYPIKVRSGGRVAATVAQWAMTESLWMKVVVAVTSLCPCSREISTYGAHNQRSHVTIEVEVLEPIEVEDLIAIAERSSSCEVYGLLKRSDEKYVTERAYENPKFVEDMVRDVAGALNRERRVGAYAVEVENF